MNSPLTTFLESCPQGEGAVCKVLEFVRAFHRTLSSAERTVWTRTRIVAQMGKLGFDLGTDKERRRTSLASPCPCAWWMVGSRSSRNLQASTRPGSARPRTSVGDPGRALAL